MAGSRHSSQPWRLAAHQILKDQQIHTGIGQGLLDSKHFSSWGHNVCQGDGE